MKYLKLFESINKIESVCELYNIKDYTINSDGSIDVNDDVYMGYHKDYDRPALSNLPIQFNNVYGSFDCSNNGLVSLKGSPVHVGGSFYCFCNNLTSLEGGPEHIDRDFVGFDNKLSTLEFAPKYIGEDFNCSSNKFISLKGCPETIYGRFMCRNSNLTNTKYINVNCSSYELHGNLFPYEFEKHINFMSEIVPLQDEFMIWNNNGTLNDHNFQELLKEIR